MERAELCLLLALPLKLFFLTQFWQILCFWKFVHFFEVVQFVGIYLFIVFFFAFGITVIMIVISPLSFLILFESSLFFFLMSFAKDWSILFFIFSANQVLISPFLLCFGLYFFSDFYYFLPSAHLRLCSFSDSLGPSLGCLFEIFIVSSGRPVYFSLRIAFSTSHRFCEVVLSILFVSKHFLISLISSLTHWYFSSMLFSLHIFVLFLLFFLQLIFSFIML